MRVLLVDGSNVAYRSFYAQNLMTTGGLSTSMVYGVISSLRSMVSEVQPDIVHVIWDPPGGSLFRKRLYKLYKANREVQTAEFYQEIDTLKQLLNALGVSQICKGGVESDDVLGYLACKHYVDHDVFCASNDKDILQILSARVKIVHPVNGIISLDVDGRCSIKEQNKVINLKPAQVADYKALVGDTSDNYPGLLGFGIGAAINYFERNESVDAILNNTADLRNQRPQALNAIMTGRNMIPLWKQLATLNMVEGEFTPLPRPIANMGLANGIMDLMELNQFKALGASLCSIGGK